MKLEDLRVYQMALEYTEQVWTSIDCWDSFARKTIGVQIMRSSDSIAANISEGYGRFNYKESKHFLYYARGSLFETGTWLLKSKSKNLITKMDYEKMMKDIEILKIKLNAYIKSIGKTNDQ